MVKKKIKKHAKNVDNYFLCRWEAIAYVFLGVGLTLFGLNISSYFSFFTGKELDPNMYVSTITALLLIFFTTYTIKSKIK